MARLVKEDRADAVLSREARRRARSASSAGKERRRSRWGHTINRNRRRLNQQGGWTPVNFGSSGPNQDAAPAIPQVVRSARTILLTPRVRAARAFSGSPARIIRQPSAAPCAARFARVRSARAVGPRGRPPRGHDAHPPLQNVCRPDPRWDRACTCSPGRIRTYNPAVTLIPRLSPGRGLSLQLRELSGAGEVLSVWLLNL